MNYSLTGVAKVIVSFALVFLLVNNYAHAEISNSEKKPLIEKSKSVQADPIAPKGEKRYIVLFKDKVGNQDLDDLVKKGAKIKHNLKSIQGVSISADDLKVQQIKLNKKIKSVVEDEVMTISLSASVPLIGANSVHAAGVTGTGAKVCIVDTGVDDSHPALNPLIAQIDYVNGDVDATDDNGHGTHVAGIVASRDSTFKGVAPNASLMAAKVLDATGHGLMSTVIAGIDWCVANGADVINLSLGGTAVVGTCDTNAAAIAVNQAVDQGVVVAAASGNDGSLNKISTPACASKAVAVGALDDSDGRTSFSNEGIELDVVAPGVTIMSLRAPVNGGGFTSLTGTSMATPHVAGLAALLLNTNSSLTAPQIISAIKNTSLDLGTPGFDTIYGFGRIRAYDAYQSVLPPIPTTLYCGKTIDQFDSVINGTESNNVIVGTSGADLIDGLGGDDRIWGKGGDDCIFGGEGADYLVGGAGNDEINGQNGNDKIWGQADLDFLFGGFGSDRLVGGIDNDSIFGEQDNDFLWGQAGDDALDGGTQTDVCVGGIGTNTITSCE